jgi:hypothetical protein
MEVETREFSDRRKLRAMEVWLDKHIGLEYERCYPTDLPTTLTIFGVEPDEYERICKVDDILHKLEEESENHWVYHNDNGGMDGFRNYPLVKIVEKLEQGV